MQCRCAATWFLAFVVALVLPVRGAQSQDGDLPGAGRVAAQIAAGTVAGPLSFVAGGLGSRWVARKVGVGEAGARRTAYVGAWTATALGTAAMPPLLVRGGNYPAALAGAAAGGLAGAALVWVGRHTFGNAASCNALCLLAGVAAVALPATGATLVYNRSR